MNLSQQHFHRIFLLTGLLTVLALLNSTAHGGGITADVGLTPPLDRWIFRTQLRYMEQSDYSAAMERETQMLATPFVLAYGLRPNLTVIARQIAFDRRMEMQGDVRENTGLGDFALISKWRAWRLNRQNYIIGIAPTLGVEFPTGNDRFSSDTWDALTGIYLTVRRGSWGADLNLNYRLNGIEERMGSDAEHPGDEFTANLALSYQFSVNDAATMSLWPVLELTYKNTGRDRQDGDPAPRTGGDILSVAPGLKFARQSFMLEALVQFPVSQDLQGGRLEREIGGLVGLRYLF